MTPFINILGKAIPIYGICWMVGIFLSGIVAVLLCKKRGIERYDIVYSAVFAVIAGVIGSKLLFIAVSLKMIIENDIPFEAVLKGGFVFYGGLIGGAVGLAAYTLIYKLNTIDFFDVYALVLPLGHAIGRIGCFFSGCCYGIKYDGVFSFSYSETMGYTPLNVKLLPIQIIEAVFLFILFLSLLFIYLKIERTGLITTVYIYSYGILRFVLEFFRGDTERGNFLNLSTSQLISVILILATTSYLILNKKFATNK